MSDYLTVSEQHRLACGTCGKRLRDHIEGVTGHAFIRTFAPDPAPLDGYVTVKTADLQTVRDMLEKAQALNAALLPAVIAAAAAETTGPSPANGPKREYIGYAEPKEADRG
jgi:hypothetical protein